MPAFVRFSLCFHPAPSFFSLAGPVGCGVRQLLWVGLILCGLLPAHAQQEAAEAGLDSRPVDVRLVIDISGSMKQNDPANLRQPAVELLLKLLPEDSKAGIWTFGRYINMLVPHREVSEAWKQEALAKAAGINSVGLYTNIGEALEKSAYDLTQLDPDYRTSLILLTDGMVDIDADAQANRKEWRRIVDQVLPEIAGADVTLHTIALSDNADKALLDKLALATDGLSEVAVDADQLMKVFLRIFDQAAPAEQLPLQDNHFLVDSSIEEFTALIFRRPGSEATRLISPDKTEYRFSRERPDANWYHTDQYDLITLQRPLEGEWTVLADMDPDSRVTVVSNLKLRVKPLPGNLFVDDSTRLSLLLQDAQGTVTDPGFLQLLEVAATVSHPDSGEEWQQPLTGDSPPANGAYQTELAMFRQEGAYDLSVLVDGKSFQRQFSHRIRVHQPFDIELQPGLLNDSDSYQLTVRANGQQWVPADTQVVARVTDPAGDSTIRVLTLSPRDEWQLDIPTSKHGRYEVTLRISGEDRNGEGFEFEPEPRTFTYPGSEDALTAPVPEKTEPDQPAPEPEKPAPEQPEPQQPEPEPEASEPIPWGLYIGLALGNLLIVALAFFAYRMVMGSGKGDSLKDLEDAVADAESDQESASRTDVEAPTPEMESIAGVEPIEQSPEPAPEAADEGLDLSREDVTDSELPFGEESDASDEEPENGFSLDDFAPDEMEDLLKDLDDGEQKK